MYLFVSDNLSPYFNLALEEVLFNKREKDFLLIYRNASSVISGKHQNPYAETDIRFVLTNKIIPARRLSGGGTVFHDVGNINFSFIVNESQIERPVFKKYSGYILDYLKSMEIKAKLNARNDIISSDNRKISGNAQHINKNRLLHHGTILFSSDMFLLKDCLQNKSPEKYKSHCTRSVKSKVVNISDYCNLKDVNEFQSVLIHFLSDRLNLSDYCLSDEDLNKVYHLETNKYSTKEWIFGYSPDYSIESEEKIYILVKKGIISDIHIQAFSDNNLNLKLNQELLGQRHDFTEIEDSLKNSGIFSEKKVDELMDLLF